MDGPAQGAKPRSAQQSARRRSSTSGATQPAETSDSAHLDHIRERNRHYQQKRRARLRHAENELEQQIAATRQKLLHATHRWRELRQTRHSLLLPLGSASAFEQGNSAQTGPSSPKATAPQAPKFPAACQRGHDVQRVHVHSSAHAQASPLPWQTPDRQPVRGFPNTVMSTGRSRQVGSCWWTPPGQTSSGKGSKQHAIFSDQEAVERMGSYWQQPHDTTWQQGSMLLRAVVEQLEESSQQLGIPVGDVDWSFQLPWTVRNEPLTVRHWFASSVPGMLAGSAEKQAQENYREPRSIETPQPPNPVALSQVYVTVGIDGFCPVSEAVDEVLGQILRTYRERLPKHIWYAICMHCRFVLENTLLSLAESERSAQQAAAARQNVSSWSSTTAQHTDQSETTQGCERSAANDLELLRCTRLMLQHSLCVIHAIMHEPSPQRAAHTPSRTVDEVKLHTRRLLANSCCIFAFGHLLEPILCRELTLQPLMRLNLPTVRAFYSCLLQTLFPCVADPSVSVIMPTLLQGSTCLEQQRMTMRLYRMLRLTPEQEQDLAARWRSWCRRREFLSKQLEAALKLLKDNAPQLEDLPPALLRSVTQAGKPGRTPRSPTTHACQRSLKGPADNMKSVPVSQPVKHGLPGSPREPEHAREACMVSDDDSAETYISLRTWDTFTPALRSFKSEVSSQKGTDSNPSTAPLENCPHMHTHAWSGATILPMHPTKPSMAQHAESMIATGTYKPPHQAPQHRMDPGAQAGMLPIHFLRTGKELLDSLLEPDTGCYTQTESPRGLGRIQMLGESGDKLDKVQEAMQAIRDVHKSDELMWLELVPPYAPLDEVQHACIGASQHEIGHPGPVFMHLCKIAARTLASEELFSNFKTPLSTMDTAFGMPLHQSGDAPEVVRVASVPSQKPNVKTDYPVDRFADHEQSALPPKRTCHVPAIGKSGQNLRGPGAQRTCVDSLAKDSQQLAEWLRFQLESPPIGFS